MTFSSTVSTYHINGDRIVLYGTFTNGGSDTGGTVKTGLAVMCHAEITMKDTAVVADQPSCNVTAFPVVGGNLVIKTTQGKSGYWYAEGY